jgi:hypothetical protein
VALALVLQYFLFRTYALREVVWAYPAAHDQTYYLTISYDTYEHILNEGILGGLNYSIHLRPPTGMFYHLQAALLYLFLGPSRLTALTLNFLYFVLLQVVLIATARRLSGRWSTALLAWGLLLSSHSAFSWAGGLMDFRIDFSAACLFGTLICLALRSGLFASRRWSIVVGLAGAYLVLFRFLTLVYLSGVLLIFAVCLALHLWWERDTLRRHLDRRRLGNLCIAVAIALVIAFPGFYFHRSALMGYYIDGHITGKESAIRLLTDGHELLYYPRSLAQEHTGSAFLKLALLSVLAAGLLGTRTSDGEARHPRWRIAFTVALAACSIFVINDPRWGGTWFWLGGSAAAAVALGAAAWRHRAESGNPLLPGAASSLFLALLLGVPIAALTLDLHRSQVVGNVLVSPLLWLAVLPAVVWGSRTAAVRDSVGWTTLGVVAILTGAFTHLGYYSGHWQMTARRADNERLLDLHDAVARTVTANGIAHPIFSLTSNPDHLPHRISQVLMYERHGVARTFFPKLGGFYDCSEKEAHEAMNGSDFIILAHPENSVTPFEQAMTALLPKLRTYCDEHFVLLGTYRIFGDDVRLYTRGIGMKGGESGWITADGLTMTIPGRVLRGRRLDLEGPRGGPLRDMPHVHADLTAAGRSPLVVPATLDNMGGTYRLCVECKGIDLSPNDNVEIHLSFDRWFIPAELGINTDHRRLVLPTPASMQLRP